jgi:hypothetical protein
MGRSARFEPDSLAGALLKTAPPKASRSLSSIVGARLFGFSHLLEEP